MYVRGERVRCSSSAAEVGVSPPTSRTADSPMAAGRRRRAPECSSMGAGPTWAEYIDLPKASCELISRAVYVFGSVPLSLRMLCTLSLSLFLSWFIPRSLLFRILYEIGLFDQRPFFSLALVISKAAHPCVEHYPVSWSVMWVLCACTVIASLSFTASSLAFNTYQ